MPDRKKVTVQRANVILEVTEDWVDRYLDQGYSVIDNRGRVIKTSMPRDIGTLQKAYADHLEEIAKLKDELAKANKTIEELKTKKTGRAKKE